MRTSRSIATGLAVAMVAGSIGAIATASSASAATVDTTTANIIGSPVNQAGTSPWGTAGNITLTAVQDGNDIDVTVSGDRGPSTSAFAGFDANTYQIQAFVRLDGAANTRGTRFDGAIGTVAVPPSTSSYATGFSISGTFANVTPGAHTVTLTDILLNSNGPSSGNNFGTPTGFDAYYNAGTTTATINAGVDWPLSESVQVVTAQVASVSGQMSGVTNYARPSGSTTATLSGAGWDNDLVSADFTAAFCDTAGANCAAAVTNTLSTNGSGDLAGTVAVPAITTAGARTIKVTAGTSAALIPITVLGTPTISIDKPVAGLGSVVTFSGSNWNPNGFGVAHGSIANINGLCLLADGPIPGPPCNDPVGNYITGPFVNGANTIVSFTASATGTISGSVTVTDPATFKIQASQKTITGGAPANTNLDMSSLGEATSKAADFAIDTAAPTGTASISPSTVAFGSAATLKLTNLADNAGAANVTKTVTWGDGTTSNLGAGVTTATKKYGKLGSFAVKVTLKDEAGNTSAPISAGTVTVKDLTKPVVTISALKASGKANTAVKGTIKDNVGAKSVSVKVIEKRSNGWFAFTGTKWVKKASKAKALAAAKLRVDTTVSTGAWSLSLKGVTKGTVYVTYFGTDKAGNASATVTYSKKITKK